MGLWSFDWLMYGGGFCGRGYGVVKGGEERFLNGGLYVAAA